MTRLLARRVFSSKIILSARAESRDLKVHPNWKEPTFHVGVQSAAGTPALKPILRSYDVVESTRYVDFDTTKAVYPAAPNK